MTPVANSTSERGQISIFFSASIVVLISIVAFVINIGLFVKAKINLQNATDAAAFSGAAVQARQLSKIAYLNWEMRNIYKEWMYKYYVIGNLNIADVENPAGDGAMSFRLQTDTNPITSVATPDPYNIPAVCIHLANSKTNICKRYAIPGLPEFGSSNLPGAEEASRAFMDVLISSKVNDCIDRTRLNSLVALTWAYNVLSDENLDTILTRQGPAILASRQGAWPRAVELAMRMRNLELVVNRAPVSGICETPGNAADINCSQNIASISSDRKLGSERITKAFYSGMRNLGNDVDSEMKDTFTLTEIPPRPAPAGNKFSASNLLIPDAKQAENPKYYLDLKLMMVNLAVFYAAMIPRADSATSGACDVSKVAIPVPGYPLGFYKNPDLITYYAVRGEAMFSGMFNPFDADDIKLTAYSAAKPFGGRIGPMLFHQRNNETFFTGRNDTGKFRSVPYISSLDLSQLPARGGRTLGLGEFVPGLPLPINFSGSPGFFWLENAASPLGGNPSGGNVQFGIPNMVYDYQTLFSTTGYTEANQKINIIKPGIVGATGTRDSAVGLMSKYQFREFKGTRLNNNVTQEILLDEIARIRAPTLYETSNYMVPSNNGLNIASKLDSFGNVSGRPQRKGNGVNVYTTNFYAPLFDPNQDDVLYRNSTEVVRTIFDFIKTQESGINKYRAALNRGAQAIFDMKNNTAAEAAGSAPGYERAARGVSDITFSPRFTTIDAIANQPPGSCASLAGQFLHFFFSGPELGGNQVLNPAGCPRPLGELLRTYFGNTNPTYNPTFYAMEYSSLPANLSRGRARPPGLSLFSAYMPGPFTGVSPDGEFINPIQGASKDPEVMRRNFYSTKLIPLDSLQKGSPGFDESSTGFPTYSEGGLQRAGGTSDTAQSEYRNPLDAGAVGVDVSEISY